MYWGGMCSRMIIITTTTIIAASHNEYVDENAPDQIRFHYFLDE